MATLSLVLGFLDVIWRVQWSVPGLTPIFHDWPRFLPFPALPESKPTNIYVLHMPPKPKQNSTPKKGKPTTPNAFVSPSSARQAKDLDEQKNNEDKDNFIRWAKETAKL